MIFLNTSSGSASHYGVVWTFDGMILGVMSDSGGTFEAASTFELGNPATNYTVTFGGSGPAAPFNLRGIESNNNTGMGGEGYAFSGSTLTVGMYVAEPGDWIRGITVGTESPIRKPSTILLLGSGLVGLIGYRMKKKSA